MLNYFKNYSSLLLVKLSSMVIIPKKKKKLARVDITVKYKQN